MSTIAPTTDELDAAPRLRPQRRGRYTVLAWRLVLAGVLLALWAYGAANSSLIPSISGTFEDLYEGVFSTGDYLSPAWHTVQAAFVGFLIAAMAGFVVGVVLGRSRLLGAAFEPALSALLAIPRIILYPPLVLWIGVGMASEVWIGVVSAFFPIAIQTMAGVRGVNPTLNKLADAFGCTRLQTVRFIVVPSALPALMVGWRIGFSSAFLTVIFAELVASDGGLGYVLMRAYQLQQLEAMFALTVLIIAIAGLANWLMWRLERSADWTRAR